MLTNIKISVNIFIFLGVYLTFLSVPWNLEDVKETCAKNVMPGTREEDIYLQVGYKILQECQYCK